MKESTCKMEASWVRMQIISQRLTGSLRDDDQKSMNNKEKKKMRWTRGEKEREYKVLSDYSRTACALTAKSLDSSTARLDSFDLFSRHIYFRSEILIRPTIWHSRGPDERLLRLVGDEMTWKVGPFYSWNSTTFPWYIQIIDIVR